MSPAGSKPLATYTETFAAEAIRNRLAVAGVQAYVTGTAVADSFGMGGAPQSRLLRVEVAAEDLDRAREILAEDRRRAAAATRWKCGQCGELNEPSFDLCWKCHSDASSGQVVGPDPVPPAETRRSAPAIETDQDVPCRPLLRGPRPADSPATRDSIEVPAEVRRALRGSIIAWIVIPPLVSCYTLYLLCRLPREYWGARVTRRLLVVAWALSLSSAALGTALWLRLLWR